MDPVNPDIVYALDVSFMKSSDGGATFPLRYGYGGPPELHVDHHALAFHPQNPDYLVSGNDGGINISTDGGENWSNPAILPVTQFYEIAIDHNNPQLLYGGTQDNGTNRTPDGGINNWDNIFGGDGFYVVVNPSNSDIIFAESQFGGLAKSVDRGRTFNMALNGIDQQDPFNWSTPIAIDPNNHDILYLGTNKIYRTFDALSTEKERVDWVAISEDLTDGGPDKRLGTITTIAVAPSNSQIIYVGTDDGNVWVSPDSGSSWNNISAQLPYRWVTRVTVDPFNEAKIYVTFSGLKWKDPQPHIFKSEDMGINWENISSNLPDSPVNAFAVDYYNTEILYAGSDVGAFVSYNGGESWETLGSNLPMVSVGDLKIHSGDNFLVAGTHGRSMYKLDLSVVNDVEKPGGVNVPVSFSLEQNYPNPFNPSTTIQYEITNESARTGVDLKITGSNSIQSGLHMSLPQIYVKLIVYDILGREISILVDEHKTPGNYEIKFEAGNLPSGVYFYKLEAGSRSQTKKMALIR